MSPFFATALLALGAFNAYVHLRASRALALGRRARWALFVGLLTVIVVGLAARVAHIPRYLAVPVSGVALDVELAVLISSGLLLLVDLARLLLWLGSKLVRRKRAPLPDPERAPSISRRELLVRGATGLAIASGVGSAAYGGLFGRRDYRVETIAVRVPGLPRALDGFTLVQLSDIHIGSYVEDRELAAAESLIREARGDLIVLTGDLLDHDLRYAPRLGRFVRRLVPLAAAGVYAIPGNHDYYAGAPEVLAAARRGGARILFNDGALVGDRGASFALLGVDDLWARDRGGGPDLGRAIAAVPPDAARVLLCHNPAFFPHAAPHVAVQLSGHTHGGQINVGPSLAPLVLPFGYVAGPYHRGDATLYVNRGFGTAGPPARVGSPPEITRVVLTST